VTEPAAQYAPLTDLCPQETVTRVRREAVALPSGAGRLEVLTLHNDVERRPETLGPRSLLALLEALEQTRREAEAGEVSAVLLEGTDPVFAAGADLSLVAGLREAGAPLELLGEMGHAVVEAVRALPVPTCARVNGTALGGGLELALAADCRISHPGVTGLGLPEVRLGLVPGWGGIFALPRLIGPELAAGVIFEDPLNGGRTLTAERAAELGVVDALTESAAGSEDARREAIHWFAGVVAGQTVVDRAGALDPDAPLWSAEATGASAADGLEETEAAWDRALERAHRLFERKTSGASEACAAAIRLFADAPTQDRAASRRAQIEALGRLVAGEQLPAAIYAMLDLVQRRGRHPSMVPPETRPARVGRVGVVGAGLMAAQLAVLFLTRLRVPVMISDVDRERVQRGLEHVRGELAQRVERGRLSPHEAGQLGELVTGRVGTSGFEDCDLVIEAVFEEIGVKRRVFADLERVVRPDCILATNTSSLLVTEMAEGLRHPERVVGIHFFNPVAAMPLVEIVRTGATSDRALATAFELARRLGKTPVGARDSSGFVVNRVLGAVLSEQGRAIDAGASPERIDEAYAPLGLPMGPLALIDLVGLPIAVHLLESLRAHHGDRFHLSPVLARLDEEGVRPLAGRDGGWTEPAAAVLGEFGLDGEDAPSPATLRRHVEDALASEISRMLEEGVVPDRQDIDLAMILGAGWPFFNGGITPYLDRVGAFDRRRSR
jgi:3-hydroxyacyl-CoA dehydrogenase/enoyl-CoA hydratase/carnithine racemase